MKASFLVAGVVVALSCSAAQSADMPVKAAQPVLTTAPHNWTGLYVGINGGYGWGNKDVNFSPANPSAVPYFTGLGGGFAVPGTVGTSSEGPLLGGQIGYNWQWTPNFVAGIETDFDFAAIDGSGSVSTSSFGFVPFTTAAEQKLTALGTLRVRAGYAVDRYLFYVTGGLAYGRVELNTSIVGLAAGLCGPGGLCAIGSSSEWRAGWTIGAGMEWAFSGSWSLKAEYLHYDLGSHSQNQSDPAVIPFGFPPQPIFTSSADFRGDIVRGGINYRF